MTNAVQENRAVKTSENDEPTNMFVDVDALREQIEYVRMLVARLKQFPGHERQIRYFLVLHDLLLEMNEKVRKHKKVLLEFWGQPT
jgi:hypothetical protein